ncbi:MAG TPA: anion transporter [Planctomycetota bacterium]|nr:anion transporter [Planctomycetota bacterium]
MDGVVLSVFVLVYLGMIVGGLPGLALDRTGVALLGAIALLAARRMTPAEAMASVDVPTIGLLFGLMVLSAQLRLGGFYGWVTRRVAAAPLSPSRLLLFLILVAGGLSALLCNDIICLAMAPVLAEGCQRRRLDPVPFLLGLACASNVGSAATLIGNPQNMLVGQTLGLSFGGYLAEAIVPSALGLLVTWAILARLYRGRWERAGAVAAVDAPPLDRWQAGKGLAVLAAIVLAFLVAPWPREVVALAGAGIVLLSRRMASRRMLGLVDGHLILLFLGLFIVNGAVERTGMAARALAALGRAGVDVREPAWLFAVTVPLSNLVSNVPAVMLLLPAARHPDAGVILALASTFAGNLLLVGSIANLIVAEQAARLGIRITWREHARVGVPVTIATLLVAVLWLLL